MNYDSCPRAIEADIWWPRTRFGLPAAAPCPRGSVGNEISLRMQSCTYSNQLSY